MYEVHVSVKDAQTYTLTNTLLSRFESDWEIPQSLGKHGPMNVPKSPLKDLQEKLMNHIYGF